jgi:hypothetical protein
VSQPTGKHTLELLTLLRPKAFNRVENFEWAVFPKFYSSLSTTLFRGSTEGFKANHSPLSTAEGNNACRYTSIPHTTSCVALRNRSLPNHSFAQGIIKIIKSRNYIETSYTVDMRRAYKILQCRLKNGGKPINGIISK